MTRAKATRYTIVEAEQEQRNKANEFIYFSLFADNFTSLSKAISLVRENEECDSRNKFPAEIETSLSDLYYIVLSSRASAWRAMCHHSIRVKELYFILSGQSQAVKVIKFAQILSLAVCRGNTLWMFHSRRNGLRNDMGKF